MGTSSAFGGQGGGTPLVPSWLGNEGLTPGCAGRRCGSQRAATGRAACRTAGAAG